MASPLTVELFKARYAEFAAQLDATIQFWMDDTIDMFNESRWGEWLEKGHAALTAHELKLSLLRAGGGGSFSAKNITSKKIGDVSTNYQGSLAKSDSAAYYQSTPYGRDYWRYVGLVGAGAVVASNVVSIEGL